MALPRYIVLQMQVNNKYLTYMKEGELAGALRCSGEEIVSPYTKFELEMAKSGDGRVNIRTCYNNKYWVALAPGLIEAVADEPDEVTSNRSCTLFEPIFVDSTTIRLRHVNRDRLVYTEPVAADVQYNCIKATWAGANPPTNKRDLFKMIDWESLLNLPKYVAFKGDNDYYLSCRTIEGHPYLQFASSDIGDPTVGNEVFVNNDGSIRLKSNSAGKFWRRSPNWIWADSTDTTTNNADTLFWPVKVGDSSNVIGLRNLGNNLYCKRLTTEGKTNCLNAAVATISQEAKLGVEESVLSRSIYNVSYRLMDARIYDQTILTLDNQEGSNFGYEKDDSMSLTFSYETAESQTWNTSISLTLGVSITIKAGIPLIAEEGITLSTEFTGAYEWGKTLSQTSKRESLYAVTVPPRTTVKVRLLATKGTSDIPFSYSVRDTLVSGEQIIYTKDDGIYSGVNSYNYYYEKTEEKMDP